MTMLDKTNTLVIVPAYNEQDSIVSVIEEIKATGFPFIVIDDGSVDETRKRAILAGARTISLPFNAGVGGALKVGFRFAVAEKYRAVIQCDADGQHPTHNFTDLIEHANTNKSHMVVGSRFDCADGETLLKMHRIAAMKLLAVVSKKRNNVRVLDTTSGFRLIAEPLLGEFAERFPEYYLGDTVGALNVASSFNYSIGTINVPFSARRTGMSSASNIYAAANTLKVVLILLLGLQFRIEPPGFDSRIDK